MRVSTLAGEEFRFWLTRRMLQRLMPVLEDSTQRIDAARPGVVAADASALQMVSEMTHAQTLQQSDFKTPFNPQPQLPLGDVPILITDMQLTITANTELVLQLQDKSSQPGRQCQVQLNSQLLHGWIHLMNQALKAAEWGFCFKEATSPQAAREPVANTVTPTYLH